MTTTKPRNIVRAITGFITGFVLVLTVGLAWIEDANAADREQYPPRDTFLCAINQPCPPPLCEWVRDCNTPAPNTDPTPAKKARACAWRRAVCHDRNLRAQRQVTRLNR